MPASALLELRPPDIQHWSPPARREFEALLKAKKVSPGGDALAALLGKSLEEGRASEPRGRVQPEDVVRASLRSEAASRLQPAPQKVLLGFTRLLDAKVTLTPPLLRRLVQAALREHGKPALEQAIREGPGDGELVWQAPNGSLQLVASLVRQLALGDGTSRQLVLGGPQAALLSDVLEDANEPVSYAVGGGGAFCSNLLAALPNVDATFYSPRPLPQELARRLGPRVKVVDATGATHRPAEFSGPEPTRINYSLEYEGGVAFDLPELDGLRLGGREGICPKESGRMILSTQDGFVPGFGGASPEVLRALGRQHDVFFFVGPHYLTQGSAQACAQKAKALAGELAALKQDNPALLRHWQYVTPKGPENEPVLLGALRGQVDSIALNATEAPRLVKSLAQAGLVRPPPGIDGAGRDHVEQAEQMLENALALKRGLGLARIQLHGLHGDLIVSDEVADPERLVQAAMRARQAAVMKATNESGEIKQPTDLWPVAPIVEGRGLAQLYAFADALRVRHGLPPQAYEEILRTYRYADPAGGQTVAFIPTHGIHDKTGGTISLGDTIDSVTLALERGGHGSPDAP